MLQRTQKRIHGRISLCAKTTIHNCVGIYINKKPRKGADGRRRQRAQLVAAYLQSQPHIASTKQEGQHPLTGQRAAKFRILANQ